MSTIQDPAVLAVAGHYPAWHVWLSDEGHIYAVRNRPGGQGYTVAAVTADGIAAAIGAAEAQWPDGRDA